jgi:hypothetical protein
MRASIVTAASLALVACSPAVPDSGRGVGFQDYNSYLANRQAAIAQPLSQGTAMLPAGQTAQGFSTTAAAAAIANAQGGAAAPMLQGGANTNPLAPRSLQEQAAMLGGQQPMVMQPAVPQQLPQQTAIARVIGAQPQPAPVVVQPSPVAAIAPTAVATGQVAAVRPRGNAPAGISETVSEMAVVGGVSDEQDFEAVAARETIESDRARLEKNRAQYQIDQPGALPQRAGVGPSIVEYALATQHPRGVKLFQRSPLRFKKIEVACGPYGNDDLAQEAFLAAGGPNRDRLGMDPDGDGYACGWDPAPYRAVLP